MISRRLFTRPQSRPEQCREGHGLPGAPIDAGCDYQKAPFFNVLAAFWIQFMTHDWFSHLQEGHNAPGLMAGRLRQRDDGQLGCRPGDRIDPRLRRPERHRRRAFTAGGKDHLSPRLQDHRNTVTAWWDASQIYGYDETSRRRVKRAPGDPAKLLLSPAGQRAGAGERQGYLPLLEASDPMNPAVGRAGGDGLPGQLDDRHELLPQGLRPRAQPVRRRLPRAGRRHARRRLRPAQPRAPATRSSATAT